MKKKSTLQLARPVAASTSGQLLLINSFTPSNAFAGVVGTLTKTSFTTTAANNTVFLGATSTTVTATLTTSSAVTIPESSTSETITQQNKSASVANCGLIKKKSFNNSLHVPNKF